MKTTWNFTEEKKPCGDTGKLKLLSYFEGWHRSADISHLQVAQPATHPWFIIIWEQLPTKAPGPNLTQPWCCYINTVIFYLRGYVVRPFSSIYKSGDRYQVNSRGNEGKRETRGIEFEHWDKVTTSLNVDDKVEYNGELFEVGPGTVVYANKRWWMRTWARRKTNN